METKIEIRYLHEEKYYSENELLKSLKVKNIDLLYKELGLKGILKKEESKGYKFSYVGLIIFKEENIIKPIVILPKYLKNIDLTKADRVEKTKQLIKLFKRYSSENLSEEELETIGTDFNANNFNIIALIDYLISDYIEYGLYFNEISDYELNGNGEINWQKTIEENTAYLSNNQVFYLDYFTSKSEFNEQDYIRNLHKYILNKCSEIIENIEIFEVLDFPKMDFLVDENLLENKNFMLKKIENEMQIQFSERKLRVLKAMHNFLEKEKSIESDDSLTLYGTKSFYNIWEKACGFILGNEYDKYKNLIAKPNWKALNSFTDNLKDTLIPDILRNIETTFFIFDAKYYNIHFDKKGNLQGFPPGINDLVKQYAYELAFKETEKNIKNFFVIPSMKVDKKITGKVELDFFKQLSPIYILELNPKQVFQKYIENITEEKTFFEEILKSLV